MATLSDNINKVILDFDSIKNVIVQNGITIPNGTLTSDYADRIHTLIQTVEGKHEIKEMELSFGNILGSSTSNTSYYTVFYSQLRSAKPSLPDITRVFLLYISMSAYASNAVNDLTRHYNFGSMWRLPDSLSKFNSFSGNFYHLHWNNAQTAITVNTNFLNDGSASNPGVVYYAPASDYRWASTYIRVLYI